MWDYQNERMRIKIPAFSGGKTQGPGLPPDEKKRDFTFLTDSLIRAMIFSC